MTEQTIGRITFSGKHDYLTDRELAIENEALRAKLREAEEQLGVLNRALVKAGTIRQSEGR